jgi:hypothetical protein
MASAPANAATIIQTTSNRAQIIGAVEPFRPALGVLNSVRLDVSAFEQRATQFNFADDVPASGRYPVAHNLQGEVLISLRRSDGETTSLGRVPISGSGAREISPFPGTRVAILNFSASGMASFDLDPGLFQFQGSSLLLQNRDPGFRNGSLDTVFASPVPFSTIGLASRCFEGVAFGDENCNTVTYRLTYDYTPAVPEPGTWLMMLLGFGAIGYSMRRRKATVRLGYAI